MLPGVAGGEPFACPPVPLSQPLAVPGICTEKRSLTKYEMPCSAPWPLGSAGWGFSVQTLSFEACICHSCYS